MMPALTQSRIFPAFLAVTLSISLGIGAQEQNSPATPASPQSSSEQQGSQETQSASEADTLRAAVNPQSIFEELQNDVLRVIIRARVLDSDEAVLWNMDMDELTIPGHGVTVRLSGDNITVEAEFTPYRQEDDTIVLIAQGQTWINNNEENKVRYQTSLKSIPIETGEPVIFYPLGVNSEETGSSNLELEITVSNFMMQDVPPQSGGQ